MLALSESDLFRHFQPRMPFDEDALRRTGSVVDVRASRHIMMTSWSSMPQHKVAAGSSSVMWRKRPLRGLLTM